MTQPMVAETAAGRYAVTASRAFVAAFTQTDAPFDTSALSVDHPADAAVHLELTAAGGVPIDLLAVPAEGVEVGKHQLTVAAGPPAAGMARLTCNLTNQGDATASVDWELRARDDTPSAWRLSFDGGMAGTTLHFVACDPVSSVDGPATTVEGGPVELAAADARGAPATPTVLGVLPANLAPCYSWTSDGVVALGLPHCGPDPTVVVSVPAVPADRTVTLTVRTTFGGTCPDNTAFLQSASAPAPLLVTHRPPPSIGSVTPSQAETGQTVEVAVTGTHLLPDAVFTVPGGGVTVTQLELEDTTARLQLGVAPDAAVGPRALHVQSAHGAADLPAALTVRPRPRITDVTPRQLEQEEVQVTADIALTGEGLETATGIVVGGGAQFNIDSITITGRTTAGLTARAVIDGDPRPSDRPDAVPSRGPVPMLFTVTLADGRKVRADPTVIPCTLDVLMWTFIAGP